MTYAEALKSMKMVCRVCEKKSKPYIDIDCKKCVDSVCIEAVEKQIQKEIRLDDELKMCICPTCGRMLEGYERFCWNCGQAIDWRDEE